MVLSFIIPNITGIGAIHGYTTYTVDSGQPSGLVMRPILRTLPEPVIPVGGGFIIQQQHWHSESIGFSLCKLKQLVETIKSNTNKNTNQTKTTK